MDQVSIPQSDRQLRSDGVRWMTAETDEDREYAYAKPARFAPRLPPSPKADQLAVDMSSERTGQLQRIALSAAEDAFAPKRCWSHMNHTHALLLGPTGRPGKISNSRSIPRPVPLPQEFA
jgi:hypothetical protein